MEDSKPPQITVQNHPSQPSRKRPLDDSSHLQDTNYYKMRAVLKDLRPHFLEVLEDPDFQNCKAAHDIRKKINCLMDLYKELMAETINLEKCSNVAKGRTLTGEMQNEQKSGEQHQDLKSVEQAPTSTVDRPVLSSNISKKQQAEDGSTQVTYIIGGSAFGWNFITYPGNTAVYYGRTKESFRSANVVSQ